jgi:serine/threonine protein kinase
MPRSRIHKRKSRKSKGQRPKQKHRGGSKSIMRAVSSGNGCLFHSPSLGCKSPHHTPSELSITKALRQPLGMKDKEILNIITKIDPEQEYFISKVEGCNLIDDNSRLEVKSCPGYIPDRDDTIFNYTDIGIMLGEAISADSSVWNLLSGKNQFFNDLTLGMIVGWFKDLSKGVSLLHDNNIYFIGITTSDIVIKKNETGRGFNLRIFDFGRCQTIKDLMLVPSPLQDHPYIYWPPEYFYMLTLPSYDVETSFVDIYSSIHKTLNDLLEDNNAISSMYSPSYIKAIIDESKVHLLNDKYHNDKKREARLKHYAEAVDYYSLAMIFLEVIAHLKSDIVDIDGSKVSDFANEWLKNMTELVNFKGKIKGRFNTMLDNCHYALVKSPWI